MKFEDELEHTKILSPLVVLIVIRQLILHYVHMREYLVLCILLLLVNRDPSLQIPNVQLLFALENDRVRSAGWV